MMLLRPDKNRLEPDVIWKLEVSAARRCLAVALIALGLMCYSGLQLSGLVGADPDYNNDGVCDVFEAVIFVASRPAPDSAATPLFSPTGSGLESFPSLPIGPPRTVAFPASCRTILSLNRTLRP